MSENQPTTASTPYEEGHITIDGLNIGYSKFGSGPNNLLCICGAVGCYKKDWPLSFLENFDTSLLTIICIDPPGYGTSRPPDRQQEVNRCMKDASFCQLGAAPFTVMGWSEGGRTAIHVAGQGGKNLVPRMVLVSTGSRINKLGAMAFAGMKNTDHWLPNAKAPYLEHCTYDFLRVQWAALCDVVQQVHDFCGGRFPSDYVLPKLECKSLILNGGMDRFCGDPKKDFVPVLKHCKVDIHAQGGHDFYLKYPKWFCARVQDFIRTNLS
ncbi:hypothetical protein WR25_13555 [Diploscapter pachys]|uniref:AB hydrolase-1 domain-containing protein n=1 Tax=Diploscapter pachys TaxID=2018661 RepID=A0A2A2JCX8_9BILA|nr:hypothetical protein WR25_13555 [Diploscapter pachys]